MLWGEKRNIGQAANLRKHGANDAKLLARLDHVVALVPVKIDHLAVLVVPVHRERRASVNMQ